MALLLYLLIAAATLLAWRQWLMPISRGAAIVLVALPMLFTGPALVQNRAYGGFDILFMSAPFSDYAKEYGFERAHNGMLVDHAFQFASWQRQVRRSFARGEWPLWNPGMLSGDVLAAGMQAAPLSPLNLIGRVLPLDLATTFDASMVLLLAALFTFAFARALGMSEGAALVAAAGYSCSSAMVFFVGWPHGRSWSVLPLVLLAVRRVVHVRDTASYAMLTGAFVLLIAFGHPETVFHVVIVGALYGLYEWLSVHEWRAIAIAFAAGITALLLMAIVLLPFIDVLDDTFEYYFRKASADAPLVMDWPAVHRTMRATFIPYYGGASQHTLTSEWEFGMGRVGSVILALAVMGAIGAARERRFWIALAAIGLLAGWHLLNPVFRVLPLFDIALNARLAYAGAFALCVLAGFAVDEKQRRGDRATLATVAVLLAIGTALLWRKQLSVGVPVSLLIAGVAAEMLGIFAVLKKNSVPILLAAIAIQRVAEDGNIYPALPREQFYPRVPLIEAIPRDPLYRFAAIDSMVVPNVGSMYGLEDVRGYAAMTSVPYQRTLALWCPDARRTWHDIQDLSRPFLNFLGVKYALTPRAMDPPPGWRVLADDRGSRLIENANAIPRVFVPRHITYIDDDNAALEQMRGASDFADNAWISTRAVPPHVERNGEATLATNRVSTARYEIDVDAKAPARIVITESNWPGWRAYIDERRVNIEPANLAFLSVHVPAGKHKVRVVYRPDAYVRGRPISIATVVLLAIGFVLRMRYGRLR